MTRQTCIYGGVYGKWTENGQGWHANTGFMHAPYTGKIGAYLQHGNYWAKGAISCPVAAVEPKGAI